MSDAPRRPPAATVNGMTCASLEAPLRKALMQRIADDLRYIAEYTSLEAPDRQLARCCFLLFEGIKHGRKISFAHRLCKTPCYHIHHQGEVAIG